jgi:HlyD family secretion protein
MKKTIIFVIGLVLVLGIVAALVLLNDRPSSVSLPEGESETTPLDTKLVNESVNATGVVNSNQSAQLAWKTMGNIDRIYVQVGDQVQVGDVLAELDPGSLSPGDLLARAELVAAQRALDDLLASQVQAAAAQQAVEAAQETLDDALNPETDQASALQFVADADKAVESADRKLIILTKPASQFAIDQAQANLVLAEKKLADNQEMIDRINKKLSKSEAKYKPWESRKVYKNILEGLERQRIQLQISYENAEQKYQDLLAPPNPADVAVAEADLMAAQAQLSEAERAWQRIKDGTSPAEIALLEAQLSDALREWGRLKDGPDPHDIIAAQARITAAQAALENVKLQAPFNGTITGVYGKQNDQVFQGSPAFRLDDFSHLWVDVGIPEIDINQVEVGQAVVLTFDAVPGKEYHGQVVEVSPVGVESSGLVTFKVAVEILDADQDIRPGITAEVGILLNPDEL